MSLVSGALGEGIELGAVTLSGGDTVVVASDCRSLLQALVRSARFCDGAELSRLRDDLSQTPWRVVFQWVPGHKDIAGNERADAEANIAAGRPPPSADVGVICAGVFNFDTFKKMCLVH